MTCKVALKAFLKTYEFLAWRAIEDPKKNAFVSLVASVVLFKRAF